MNIKKYLIAIVLALVVFSGCEKEEQGEVMPTEKAPVITLSIKEDTLSAGTSQKILFKAAAADDKDLKQEWKLGGVLKSSTGQYEFSTDKSGIYVIDYTATNNIGTFKHTYTVNVDIPVIPVQPGSNKYVTTLFEYLPAPGQFINTGLGDMEGAKSILGKEGIVSLGSWGGYIVLGFDHTVINKKDAPDIMVVGNPLPNFAEPGIIWVMEDENGNGLPDDTWYEVAGSEFDKPGYVRDYEVTFTRPDPVTADVPWRDNKGNKGVVETNIYHTQPYFPEWIKTSEYTLKGSLLSSRNIDMSNPRYITSAPFDWGYADNTMGGDAIEISNAIDKNGKKVVLKGVDFIKIQTGVQANMGWLGELSTEVLSVYDLNMGK